MSNQEDPKPKEQPRKATSGTRHGNGAGHGGPAQGPGAWGKAVGLGWGGPKASDRPQPMNAEERAALRHELISIYLAIARDPEAHGALRMAAAEHLLSRLDNPFDRTFGGYSH